MADAIRDDNRVTVLMGVSSTDDTVLLPIKIDPVTGRILAESTGGGSGDVTGPGSSTDNAVVRFDGAGGTTIQDSGVIIDDTDNITGVTSITVGNTGLVVGSSTPFSDSSGTLTLQNIDALDATTEATIEAAIDTLANLTAATALVSVGTLTTGTWNATAVAVAYGGTGAATAGDARTNLGLVIGTDVQAYDAELAAIAGLTSAADKLPYFTGSGTAAVATFTAAARSVLDDASVSDMRTTLGVAIGSDVQAYDADLAALAGLTSAADKLPYFTGSGTADVATFTAAARTLLDDASVGDMRTTLGVAIGSDVQAYGAVLDDLNTLGANSADSEFLVGTGAGALAWESGATVRTSLGLGSIATQAASSVAITGGAIDGVTIGATTKVLSIQVDESGITVDPTGDADADLLTVGVTGSPKLFWDESQDQFSSNKGLDFTSGSVTFNEVDNGNSSTADTIDFTAGNKHKSTLTDNCTFTFTAPAGPCNLILRLVQDGTGSRTVTWPATVTWPGGTAPTLTTTASGVDIVSFYYDGTNYHGQAALAFAVPA